MLENQAWNEVLLRARVYSLMHGTEQARLVVAHRSVRARGSGILARIRQFFAAAQRSHTRPSVLPVG